MTVIPFPSNKTWQVARDARTNLYNHPAWYHKDWRVRDNIQKEWEKHTLILRQEEEKVNRRRRDAYQLPR